ncbi:hypothetical protein OHB02_14005 [Streptomyces albidoflavus]|uniref:hypothetical protein n=1 Tax=Streptomyces TaxID=1883 RepID=UPI001E38656D|nr:hypothetical protein [Streptomyces sp. OUCMDZ-3434]WSB21267.1 hypothetical protein OHB02_14005 [Streptomyces albidoflavus]
MPPVRPGQLCHRPRHRRPQPRPEGVDCAFTVVPTHTAGPLQRLTGFGVYTARHGERKVAYRFAHELG